MHFRNDISQAYVKQLFDYDPEVGDLVRRENKGFAKAGDIAGRIDKKGYRYVKIDSRGYFAHRIIWLWMTGEWPEEQIDHVDVNGPKSDNRWSNLRLASQSENQMNRGIQKNNKSGIPGVGQREDGKFRVRLGKEHIGYYDTIDEALSARLDAQSTKWTFQPTPAWIGDINVAQTSLRVGIAQ